LVVQPSGSTLFFICVRLSFILVVSLLSLEIQKTVWTDDETVVP
jgi:hypothetical protein